MCYPLTIGMMFISINVAYVNLEYKMNIDRGVNSASILTPRGVNLSSIHLDLNYWSHDSKIQIYSASKMITDSKSIPDSLHMGYSFQVVLRSGHEGKRCGKLCHEIRVNEIILFLYFEKVIGYQLINWGNNVITHKGKPKTKGMK